MGVFENLFGDARGAAARAQATIGADVRASRARIEEAADVVDDRAQASAAEMRGIAKAFRALGDEPSALQRQAVQQASRSQTQGAARQAALSGGPLNANRLQMSELEATSMAQALLAERSQRIQSKIAVNQAIGQQLLMAGKTSQSGAAARLESLSAFEQAALQAQSAAAMARAQAEGQPSAFGRFLGGAATAAFGIASAGGFGNPFGVPTKS